jgi:OOP family OmpA-OmpF porin
MLMTVLYGEEVGKYNQTLLRINSCSLRIGYYICPNKKCYMKKITLISFLVATVVSFGQITKPSFNRWSIDLSGGINSVAKGMTPGYKSNLPNVGSFEVGTRYMLNADFGFDLNVGFDNFGNSSESPEFKTNVGRLNLQGVLNLGNALKFYQWTEKFTFLAHAGVGMADFSDDGLTFFFSDHDRMGQLVVGLTPQYKLSRRLAINLDVTAFANARQNNTFDFQTYSKVQGFNDRMYVTYTAGISYYLGRFDQHADWSPTKAVSKEEMDLMRADMEKMRRGMKDEDRDGVPNYLDEEPITAEGALVDNKGVTDPNKLDTDKDGIPDSYDACPEQEGKFATNGCPDADGDGVADKDDKCPSVPGVASAQGCPQSGNEKVNLTPSLDNVYFEVAKSTITKAEMDKLNRVVDHMNANPNHMLIIKGHADKIGSFELNQKLSEERAQTVLNYLLREGIDPSRMNTVAYGSMFPISSDNTQASRKENRRVELDVRF